MWGANIKMPRFQLSGCRQAAPPRLAFFIARAELAKFLRKGGGQLEGKSDKRQGVVVVGHYRTGGVSKQKQPSKTGLYCM